MTIIIKICEFTIPISSVAIFHNAGVLFAPGKASNAGGVATSGLEMSQNSSFQHWSREMVDDQLKMIMQRIHHDCYQYLEKGCYHYENAANVLGFSKVADAIKALG